METKTCTRDKDAKNTQPWIVSIDWCCYAKFGIYKFKNSHLWYCAWHWQIFWFSQSHYFIKKLSNYGIRGICYKLF